jgi:hypothetical protein
MDRLSVDEFQMQVWEQLVTKNQTKLRKIYLVESFAFAGPMPFGRRYCEAPVDLL